MEEMTGNGPPYEELGILADSLLDECDEDVSRLADRIGHLPLPVRDSLLASDFLNAYQVFYFFFRFQPSEIEMDRLILLPASELQYGIRINEIELLELIFAVADREPVIVIGDGDRVLARYSGSSAYKDALGFIESAL